MLSSNEQRRLFPVLKRAIEASFNQSDWTEIGYETGTREFITGHPRLLRSLRFEDDDYGANIFEFLEFVMLEDVNNGIASIIKHPKISRWLQQNDPDIYATYAGAPAYTIREEEIATDIATSPADTVVTPTPSVNRNDTMAAPRVFISYSHDSDAHVREVLELSNRLRTAGIDCRIDQYEESPQEGWPRWMLGQIDAANFVLVVCTRIYEQRVLGRETPNRGLGASWEGAVITQEIYENQTKTVKFIPVVLAPENTRHIPVFLRGQTNYLLRTPDRYEALYRRLTGQPSTVMPDIGHIVSLPPREARAHFSSIDPGQSEETSTTSNITSGNVSSRHGDRITCPICGSETYDDHFASEHGEFELTACTKCHWTEETRVG